MDKNLKGDALLREMKRKSLDNVKVKNPTEKDFIIVWDSIKWLVPKKGEQIFPRYLAAHYVTHMTDKLINDENEEMLAKARKKYNGNDWYHEEERISLRTNNPTLRKKYLPLLWGGVTREYGMDVREEVDHNAKAPSGNPLDYDLIEEYENSLNPDKPKEEIKTKHPATFEEQIVE